MFVHRQVGEILTTDKMNTFPQITIEAATPDDFDELIEVWESSVRATHDFLNENDILSLKPLIRNEYFQAVAIFCVRQNDKIVGFMGLSDDKIEMLFIRPENRGQGIGKKLIELAVNEKNIEKVDVNEQNPQAVGFYEHMGFKTFKRNPTDSQGRPFPILEMSRNSSHFAAKNQQGISFADDVSSAFTHAIGGYLGVAALVLLIIFAVRSGNMVAWKVVGGTIFASTTILLYSVSSLYHAVRAPRLKRVLQICDHAAIYFLIAGSYTPFCLVTLRPQYPVIAWSIFGTVWGLTVLGVVFKIFATDKLRYFSTLAYIAMGWLAVMFCTQLAATLPFGGIVWLILGGGLYTLGTVFYLWRIMPLHHTIWHLFVLAGTICHFFAVLFYVMTA